MRDPGWYIGGDYDAWKTAEPSDEEEEEIDDETLGDMRYHEQVERDIEEKKE